VSTVNPVQLDPNVSYPEKWTYAEYLCNCSRRIRVGAEVILGPYALETYQHCVRDDGQVLPGPVFAVWELRGDDWILTWPPRSGAQDVR
jgi:hypothetical protein